MDALCRTRWATAWTVALALAAALAPSALANGVVIETNGDGGGSAGRSVGPMQVVLARHDVAAVLHGRLADVTVDQTFRNQSSARLEGVYLFPLPDDAVVARFSMTMGGRLVEGQMLAADEARRVYESIVRRRRDPGLLEYAGRGLYRASVYPIEPRGEIHVRLSYQQVLREDADTLEFRYPLATDRLNGEPVDRVAMDVLVDDDADVRALYSPTHSVVVERDGERRAHVTWARAGGRQDRDFLLYVGHGRDAVGLTLVSDKPGAEDGTFLAVLAPRVTVPAGERAPRDVVFALDVSGSMEGEKLENAQKAIAAGIDRLRPIDRFGVIAFSTSVVQWRDGLVAADAAAKTAAVRWLLDRPATGGTDIEGALLRALDARSQGRLMLVVFVTDGRPTVGATDAEDIVRHATRANPSKARVFIFGVGSDLNVGLLDSVAEATGGAREYVTGGEDLRLATARFYTRVDDPVMADVHVDFGPGVYDVYPRHIPDIYAGGQVVLFGRYRGAGARDLTLTGTVAGAAVSWRYAGSFRSDAGPVVLPRLWAQRKIAYLLDEIRLHGAAEELTKEVIRLGTRFAIVTPYTSSLVTDDAELEPRVAGGSVREPRDPSPPPFLGEPTTPTTPPSPTTPRQAKGPKTRPATPTARAPAPDPISESERLKRAKEVDSAEDTGAGGRVVKSAGGRTFVLDRTGRFVDTRWDGKAATMGVAAFSPAWFDWVAKGDAYAAILALGPRVLFVDDGVAYEIMPMPDAR